MTDLTDEECIERYKDEIAKFKEFCEGSDLLLFERTDFYDLSIGFFIALGVDHNIKNHDPELDVHAFQLARICRYRFEYWC